MAVVCELEGVRKRYGSRTVLDDFNLIVDEGDMVAITGHSGAGKTTVLNLLGLLEPPDGGTLRLFGKPGPAPRSRKANLLRREKIAYLFQNYALIDNDTVGYNLAVAATYTRQRGSHRRLISAALGQVGLRGMEHRKVFELSGGEQQRVAVARILLKPCELVLADEPTGSLDPDNRNEILRLLDKLNHDGKTIVLATHDEEVAGAAARVVKLD